MKFTPGTLRRRVRSGPLFTAVSLVIASGVSACADAPAAERYLTLPDTRLLVETVGAGPDTVVVLHGGPAWHHGYLVEPLAGLSRGRTLLFYDMRGRGRSEFETDTTRLTMAQDLADLDSLLVRHQLGPVTLVGHHWGAAVAARFAARHPDRVRRLVLLSPFPVHHTFLFEFAMLGRPDTVIQRVSAAIEALDAGGDPAAFCRAYWGHWFAPWPVDSMAPAPVGPALCALDTARVRDSRRIRNPLVVSLGAWRWRDSVAAITAPTLVIEGAGEPIVEGSARRWAQHVPGARLLLVPRPYLFPWVGAPGPFRRSVATFLDGKWPEGAGIPEPFEPEALPDRSS